MTNEIMNLMAWVVTILVTNTTEIAEQQPTWEVVHATNPSYSYQPPKRKITRTTIDRVTYLRFLEPFKIADIERSREPVSVTEVVMQEVVSTIWVAIKTNQLPTRLETGLTNAAFGTTNVLYITTNLFLWTNANHTK